MRGHRDDDIYISGKPALQASSGGNYPENFSEVYFDNIRVTSLETPTPTPTPSPTPTPTPTPSPTPGISMQYFSQSDPQWKDSQYDSTNRSIGRLGCAITVTAMVLKYHGIDKIPDGEGNLVLLTPLTFNQWLIDNDAFSLNGELLYLKVASASKELIARLKADGSPFDFDTLEYNKIRFFSIPTDDFVRIDRYLTNYLHPLIFKEASAQSSSGNHFVVATNVVESGKEYGIKDPISENRTTTVLPPDILRKVIYFRPANSDLSYLQFQTNANLHMSVKTPFGMVSESQSATDSANISYEEPIIDEEDPLQYSGHPMWEFDYQYPPSGEYFLKLLNDVDGFRNPWLYFFDVGGGEKTVKQKYFGAKNHPTNLKVVYDKNNAEITSVEKVVDYQTLLSDLMGLKRLGWLKQKNLYFSLEGIFRLCKPFHQYRWRGFEKMWQSAIKHVEKIPDKHITPEAREILLYDMNYILNHYNGLHESPHRR